MSKNSKNVSGKIETSEIGGQIEKLIFETLGSQENVTKLFEECLKTIDSGNTPPLGEDDVKSIIRSLLKKAVACREKINLRIQEGVSNRTIGKYYYDQMEEIDELTKDTHLKMLRLLESKEKYEYKKLILEQITGNAYEDNAKPGSEEVKQIKKRFDIENRDIWSQVDYVSEWNIDETKQRDLE